MTALKDDGATLHLGTSVDAVGHDGNNFSLDLANGETLSGDGLLVVAGQKPNTDMLNAEAAGIELDKRGNIKVDSQFKTSATGVYAIGDVTGQPAFTHVSWEDFRRLMSVLKGGDRTQGDRVLGYAFFTDPEVGRAGMTRDQAEEQGYNVREVTLPLTRVTRAYLTSQDRGFFRLVIDRDNDRILGATLVGPEAGELIHVIIDLMEAEATWQLLEQSVHIHPTLAEGLPTLARLLTED
jgi:dihydrolipoamide dehydrogenase